MAFTQQSFANGDIDYIAKLNANASAVAAAVNQLLLATGSSASSSPASPGLYLDAVFGGATTLIGLLSYKPTASGNNLNVASGSVYRAGNKSVVSSAVITSLGFVGLASGTYYVATDSIGVPIRETSLSQNSMYSVVWSGSSFGTITLLVRAAFTALEENDSRVSTTNAISYTSLDARMEAIEGFINGKLATSVLSTDGTLGGASASDAKVPSQKAAKTYTDSAVAAMYAQALLVFGNVTGPTSSVVDNHLAVFNGTTGKLIRDGGPIPAVVSSGSYGDLSNKPTRKVGVTIDGGGIAPTLGVKGAIQVDFDGTITGWSIIADQAGSIDVEVSVKRTSPPTAPPAAPLIPNPLTDKISASAPIRLTTAQSASAVAAGVATWVTAINKWDVVQFNVSAVSGLVRASLYFVVQEP